MSTASSTEALSLEEAISQALARNERARAADEETRAADARVGRARSFLFPDLTLTGDYTRQRDAFRSGDETSRNQLTGRVTLNQTLFDAQAWPLLGAARKSRDATRFDASDEKRRLAFETAEAYLTVLNTEQVVQAASGRLDLARSNLEEVRVRFDAQLVGSNDVTRAELEAASSERELVEARGAASVARLSLGYLLGTPVEDSLEVPAGLLTEAQARIEVAISREALDRRPDVQAGRARTAALRATAREPNLRYVPDLNLFGTASHERWRGIDFRDDDWTFGLALTWDLFDGGLRHADHAERAALARASQLVQENLERRVLVDVEAARVALESRQASLARADVALEAARRNAAEAGELYRRGLVRALEVVDANVQLFSARVERLGSQYALTLAFLDLRAALGLDPLGTEALP